MENFQKRKLESDEFIHILNDRIKSGSNVCLSVTGGSMRPFLDSGRDSVILSGADKINRGDIIFFVRDDGRCVLHRVVKIKGESVYAAGDAQSFVEGPIARDKILAKAVGAVRGGKSIDTSSFIWRFYAKIWVLTVKIRPFIFKLKRKK